MKKIRWMSSLLVLPVLSSVALAGAPKPAFSLVCTLSPSSGTTVTFAGNGFQKGHVFRSWDLQGSVVYQGTSAAGAPVEIKIPVEAPNLIDTNGAFMFRSQDSTPAGFEAALTIWLPSGNNLGSMGKTQEFSTATT